MTTWSTSFNRAASLILQPQDQTPVSYAGDLLKSLDEPSEADRKELWLDVAERRLQEMREGKVRQIPAEEVFARERQRRSA